MRIIGITGPTGAGKSLLGSYVAELGIPLIDADRLYHSMLLPPSACLDAIREAFGDSVFNTDGTLDRTKLGEIVFNSDEKLKLLNSTVLGTVIAEIRRLIESYISQGFSTVAVDAPTLIESGFDKECWVVISVISPKEPRVARIMERDSISREAAELRVKAQKNDEFYIENSDIILNNNSSTERFLQDIKELCKGLELI